MRQATWTAMPTGGSEIRWASGLVLLLLSIGGSAAAESWTATSTTNAPEARRDHTAVWTGSRMVVWGGANDGGLHTGGVYHPVTDTWTATSTTSAPTPRCCHTAVWTGSKMIVWGGASSSSTGLNTGGIYDPATDTWTAMNTTNAPAGRDTHTVVWTGSKMIVWGGANLGAVLNTGGIYDPEMDTWTAMSTTYAPEAREHHTAVWTGSKMIVWGGIRNFGPFYLNSGGTYDPATDTWTATSTTNAPAARDEHTAVWTGSKMIVWGGLDGGTTITRFLNTGGLYDPATDTWTATNLLNAPTGASNATAVRMGSRMIVWGGLAWFGRLDGGGIYDPATDSWTATSTATSPRQDHTAVWTGSRMIVWGGDVSLQMPTTNTGAIYAPPGTEGPLVAGIDRVLPLVPQCGILDGAQALSVNLAVTQGTAAGNLRLYPSGTQLPTVSSLNYSAGQTRSNNAIVTPNVSGELTVRLAPSGTAHFILDVNGYFDSTGDFFTLTPCRAVDTRNP